MLVINLENEENVKNEVNTNKTESRTKKKNNKKRMVIVLLFSIVLLVVLYIMFRGHYLEVLEIGEKYVQPYYKDVNYKIITIVLSFIWIYVLMYTTNKRIKKGLKIFCDDEKKELPKFPNKSISFITAAIGSIITSNIFLQKTILFLNNTSFGKTDPVYGHDIGYYLFIKPFLQGMLIYVLVTIAIVTLYAAIYYIILLNTHFTNGVNQETLKKSILKKQLLNNLKVIVVVVAMLTFLNSADLSSRTFISVGEGENLYSLVGAGSTDVTIKVWGYRILSIIMIILAFIAASAYQKNKQRRLAICIGFVPVYLVGMILTLMVYNKLFVNSNEYEKEKRYISYNIENTREAYGVDVEEVNLEEAGIVDLVEISNHSDVIDNISTTNGNLVLKSLNGTLTNKGTYKYTSTKPGLYNIREQEKLVYRRKSE